jgi:hypothetical protein
LIHRPRKPALNRRLNFFERNRRDARCVAPAPPLMMTYASVEPVDAHVGRIEGAVPDRIRRAEESYQWRANRCGEVHWTGIAGYDEPGRFCNRE